MVFQKQVTFQDLPRKVPLAVSAWVFEDIIMKFIVPYSGSSRMVLTVLELEHPPELLQ